MFIEGYDDRIWSWNEEKSTDKEELTDEKEVTDQKEYLNLSNMPALEGDEEVREGKRLKILTPNIY